MFAFPTDISATEFMERRGNLKSRYELLGDFLSDMLSVGADDVNVFSLVEVRDRTLDVRFTLHSVPFLRAEKVHGYLAAHKQKVRLVGGGGGYGFSQINSMFSLSTCEPLQMC